MVISNEQRRAQNAQNAKKKRKAARKAKAKLETKPEPKPEPKLPKPKPKSDNAVLMSELDLPPRVISSLEEAGLHTKGDTRKYVREHGSIQEVNGIGEVSAELIEGLI